MAADNRELYGVVLTQKSNGMIGYWYAADRWVQRPDSVQKFKDAIFRHTKEAAEELAIKLQIGEDDHVFIVTIQNMKDCEKLKQILKQDNTMNGLELIQQERKRQQEVEGWTLEHDSLLTNGELKTAALCYWGYGTMWDDEDIADMYPWGKEAFKPNSNRIKNLIKAGALYMAENDRTNTNECGIQINMLAKKIDLHIKYLNEQVSKGK